MNRIDNDNSIKVEWTTDHEIILIEWADKAMCYRWLHSRANSMFSRLNSWYTIPVIIISTLTGTANFAQERVPIQYQPYFTMIVGGFNILAGIVTTIQQFLKITQLNEAHRVASIAWDKFYRNVKIELAKHPNERMDVTQMIKIYKEEYDRLMETSPNIPDKIIRIFKKEFQESNNDMPKIITPEVCDTLISTELSRNTWFSKENEFNKIRLIENKEKEMEKERETKYMNSVVEFKESFYNINNRYPLEEEIIDNLKDTIELPSLKKSIEQINISNV
jgi:hypothetical protein